MISCYHSKALIRARVERGRGDNRKTAIGFRREVFHVAYRSGNSSGRGETATYSILQANTCRSGSDEYVRDGRPQAVANANRIAGSINWASVVGTASSAYKTCGDSSEVGANQEDLSRCSVTATLCSPRGGAKIGLFNFDRGTSPRSLNNER